MGWWKANEAGDSLINDGPLNWGDEPADAMDDCLDRVEQSFLTRFGRMPTIDEVKSGLLFSARPRYEVDS